jgi:phosphatidate phosphatase PAH1
MRPHACLAGLLGLVACSSSPDGARGGADARIVDERPDGGSADSPDGGTNPTDLPRCEEPGLAIVTDIDATLTTSDNEFLTQLLTGSHEPEERPGGADLINAYAERGYYVLYLTSRPDGAPVGLSGESTTDATLRWLTEHGYPVDPARTRLMLAPGLVFGASSADYKGGALLDMQAEGFEFAYAYGNATSDIDAYAAAQIPKDDTFIIGPEGGTSETIAVPGDGWLEHIADVVDPLPSVCRWE